MLHSRRAFLRSSAAVVATGGLGGLLCGADLPATGAADANLGPFDKLFTEFIAEHKLPGAGVAVTRHRRLVYARGFGYADVEKKRSVQPDSLFRVASVSKPITAVGVMLLAEQGKLKLDDSVFKHIKLKPAIPTGEQFDTRWEKVTIRQCLQHTGGWDRDKENGFDPIGVPWKITQALKLAGAPAPDDIVRYMMGQPLDFDPGTRMAYSNLGYLVLGRVMEDVTGEKYELWMKKHVLGPVKASGMALGRGIPEKRPAAEVRYYDSQGLKGECLYPPRVGRRVPLADGAQNVEGFEAHGGWVASAVDLMRFAVAFDSGHKSPLLSADSIKEMWARPTTPGADAKPNGAYYGCGWSVRPTGRSGKVSVWHTGMISGTSTLLVRRFDGLNWAVLFNTDANKMGERPADLIDSLMHDAADAVKTWPSEDLFEKFT